MKKKKNNFTTFLLVLVLLAGLSLLLYPTVSDYWNSFHQTEAITGYAQQISHLDEDRYAQLLDAPIRLYTGDYAASAAPGILLLQSAWTVALAAAGLLFWRVNQKRMVVQGG